MSERIVNTCCFFGHRTINETEEMKTELREAIKDLIINKKVDTFLFGSKSRFDELCLEIVTKIKAWQKRNAVKNFAICGWRQGLRPLTPPPFEKCGRKLY